MEQPLTKASFCKSCATWTASRSLRVLTGGSMPSFRLHRCGPHPCALADVPRCRSNTHADHRGRFFRQNPSVARDMPWHGHSAYVLSSMCSMNRSRRSSRMRQKGPTLTPGRRPSRNQLVTVFIEIRSLSAVSWGVSKTVAIGIEGTSIEYDSTVSGCVLPCPGESVADFCPGKEMLRDS